MSNQTITYRFRFSFAQFFIAPLFDPCSTDRELEAVNSEYEGNVSKDSWRFLQLDRSTSDPSHPFSRFSIGNTESLRTTPKALNIDVREVLLNFHRQHYSANRMSLAVLGNRKMKFQILFKDVQMFITRGFPFRLETLDELQAMVLKSFTEVHNKNLPKVIYQADPYGQEKQVISFLVV